MEHTESQQATSQKESVTRGLGLCSIDELLTPVERTELVRDIASLRRAQTPTSEDLNIILD